MQLKLKKKKQPQFFVFSQRGDHQTRLDTKNYISNQWATLLPSQGGGYSDIFTHTKTRLYFEVQNSEFQYFLEFSEK